MSATPRIKRKTPNGRMMDGLRALWEFRAIERQAKEDGQNVQKTVIEIAKGLGYTKEKPLPSFDTDDLTIVPHLMQNTTSILDNERFVEWLKANNLWDACSTRVIDMRKVESEVASGAIKKSVLARFTSTNEAAPFIRFDKKPKVK